VERSCLASASVFCLLLYGCGEPSLPAIESPRGADRILIIAPHIDDETLGAGGYAFDAVRAGSFVAVAYLTAGDCNPLPAMIDDRRIIPGVRDFLQEGRDRIAEGKRAMQSLGVAARNVYILGYPDRGLKTMLDNPGVAIRSWATRESHVPYPEAVSPNAPYTLENLQRDLEGILRETRPTIVIMPVSFDLHPDHATSAPIMQRLLGKDIRVLSYLVHAHEFPDPFFLSTHAGLDPPRRLALLPWKIYKISGETEQRKQAAIRMYRTQRRDPHLYLLTEAFIRRNELFLLSH
jgi:LmbE family N-acetylglucosaminyl deacetylase